MGMNYYLNCVIESLKQKINTYEQDSDTYSELKNVIEILERGLLLDAKYERQY